MNVISPSVEIMEQEPGIIGMKKHIERVGRISYKSEERITDDSYVKFVEMLYQRGHWAVFNLGTVYLTVPSLTGKSPEKTSLDSLLETVPYTKFEKIEKDYYITTNYRVICQLGLEKFMEKYWTEPTEHHYHRITSHWICSRTVSHQLVRHRSMSFIMESQRYINYSKDKFGGITYIIPQWAKAVRNEIGRTLDPLTFRPRTEYFKLEGEELWRKLTTADRSVAGRDKLWKACEEEYLAEIREDEMKPEDARGVLPGDVKTELCMCGYVEDYIKEPKKDEKEKYGFFYLRTAPDAQSDFRELSKSLLKQFKDKNLINLK